MIRFLQGGLPHLSGRHRYNHYWISFDTRVRALKVGTVRSSDLDMGDKLLCIIRWLYNISNAKGKITHKYFRGKKKFEYCEGF